MDEKKVRKELLKRNNKYYTLQGFLALRNRLDNWIKIYNAGKYPVDAISLGFGNFSIKSEKELKGRVQELSELIGTELLFEIHEEKEKDGSLLKKELIKKNREVLK